MNKLTAEKCRELLKELLRQRDNGDISIGGNYTLQALEIALPILEQQERGCESLGDNLKHVGYLFINSGGGVVYSPSGYGMKGFTCLGKIYADTSLQPERATNQNGEQ